MITRYINISLLYYCSYILFNTHSIDIYSIILILYYINLYGQYYVGPLASNTYFVIQVTGNN